MSRRSLQNRQGPESDPLTQGSSARPVFGSDPEREALIDEAVVLFSRLYQRSVTEEEAREMTDRLVAYAKLLMEWDSQARSNDARADG